MKWKQAVLTDDESKTILEGNVWPVNDDGTEQKKHRALPGSECWCTPRVTDVNGVKTYLHNPVQ
jgi:hypothetical protein